MTFLPLFLFLSLLAFTNSFPFLQEAETLASFTKTLRSPVSAFETWNFSDPSSVCSWAGVSCDGGGGIAAINLSNLNISGAVSLPKLANLRYLNISGNQFSGDLEFDYNKSLPNLQVFDAYDNNFTAPLPLGFTNLRRLRYLDLGGNFFYGKIPKSYGDMAAVESLSLTGNDLRGRIPAEMGNLSRLNHLYLGYYNLFEGGIPSEIGKLGELVHLDLSSCGVDGLIPNELGELINLDTLYLHTNALSGRIPAGIGNLTRLTYLDLSNNALTGEIPREFAALIKLRLFNLFMNRLHGSIPEFVAAGLPELETLELFMNNFTGAIPERLGSSGRLQLLDLSSNKLTGTVPEELCPFNRLKVLILFKNFLFGPLPESLGKCSGLTRVRLAENYFNGSVPSGLIYLPRLDLLELQNNYFSGTISENYSRGGNSRLTVLNLSNNLLSGAIPDSISRLACLETLILSGNRFSGEIPASIGGLVRIERLDFGRNEISGTIPPEIGRCKLLTYLDLGENNFSGGIPAEIASLGVLSYLNLSRNRLSDSIPRAIGSISSLTAADFSFNDLSGRLPDSGQLAFLNASAFAGNPRLCGAAINNPCAASPAAAPPPLRRLPADFKLFFALGLLLCSLAFAAAAAAKLRRRRRSAAAAAAAAHWKMTAFQKVGFGVREVVESMKEGSEIGRGGAGVVYLGRSPGGDGIAVKKLMGFGTTNGHDHGFRAEIRTLGSIRHRNIVRLLAFCSDARTNVLVYEYMRNGSLGEVLHGKRGGFLEWDRRYRIALEAARGLCYLHHDCRPMIIHRDVKSNNILLDANFEAHVADFGLARFLMMDGAASECMSAVAGSYGYIAPEYAYTLKVDEKSDVYSFGVVLLELITGRRPVGDFGDGVDIVQWVKKTITNAGKQNVDVILDSRILSSVPLDEAMHVFFIAMLCVQENSIERPTMREVVQMLSEFTRHVSSDDHISASSSSSSASSNYQLQQTEHSSPQTNCYKLFPDLLS